MAGVKYALIAFGCAMVAAPAILAFLEGAADSDEEDQIEADLINWLMGKPLSNIDMIQQIPLLGFLVIAIGVTLK
jgi:hypothetical protein